MLYWKKDDDIEEDDIEGNKALTLEEFRVKAMEKLEVTNSLYFSNSYFLVENKTTKRLQI